LLNRDPKQRLGAGVKDSEEIKNHPYFGDYDWIKLKKKQVNPPFKPNVVCNFPFVITFFPPLSLSLITLSF